MEGRFLWPFRLALRWRLREFKLTRLLGNCKAWFCSLCKMKLREPAGRNRLCYAPRLFDLPDSGAWTGPQED